MAERLDRFCKATHRTRAQAARMALELFLLAEEAPAHA